MVNPKYLKANGIAVLLTILLPSAEESPEPVMKMAPITAPEIPPSCGSNVIQIPKAFTNVSTPNNNKKVEWNHNTPKR